MQLETLRIPELSAAKFPLPPVEKPTADAAVNPFHNRIGDKAWLHGAQQILEDRIDSFTHDNARLTREVIPDKLYKMLGEVIIGSSEVGYIESRYRTAPPTLLTARMARQLAVEYTPDGPTITHELSLGEDSFIDAVPQSDVELWSELGLNREEIDHLFSTNSCMMRKMIELEVSQQGFAGDQAEEVSSRLNRLLIHSDLGKLATLFTYTAAQAYLWGRLGSGDFRQIQNAQHSRAHGFSPFRYTDHVGRVVTAESPGVNKVEVPATPWTEFLFS